MDINNFIPKAKELVVSYTNENLKVFDDFKPLETSININESDVYVVWFSKTLQNAKALLSTKLADGMYYEVTYNGNKDEIYFDAYKKVENIRVEV